MSGPNISPSATPISGCCQDFGDKIVYGKEESFFKLKINNDSLGKDSYIYNVNMGDGTVIRSQDLTFQKNTGYQVNHKHTYHDLGNYKAYLVVDSISDNRRECARLNVIVLTPTPSNTVTPTPSLTSTVTPTPSLTSTVTPTPSLTSTVGYPNQYSN